MFELEGKKFANENGTRIKQRVLAAGNLYFEQRRRKNRLEKFSE